MLKIIDDGVAIELTGRDGNLLFWLSFCLVVVAIAIAILAMTMPTEIAIGALAVLAVLVFCFNLFKQHHKNNPHIKTGKLIIKRLEFSSHSNVVKLSEQATISIKDDRLIIADLGRVWQVSGFESQKELLVAQSVLEGKPLQKQERAIRLL